MSEPVGLSLDQAPPIGVPMRFFLTAPLFSIAAAGMLLWQGPDMFASRWMPALLGTTHLLTLGFMGLAMLGAILQMLPVVAGTPMRRPALVAGVAHTLTTAGVVLLAAGLAGPLPAVLKAAMPILGGGLLFFAFAVVATLRRALPGNMTARAMRLAVLMLAATAALGLTLAANHAFGWWLRDRESATDLHLICGLLGWVGILIAGVAYQVVPMFQLTPAYPTTMTRWLAPLLFLLLLGLGLTWWAPALRPLFGVPLAATFAVFAATTLWLQTRRRRKLPDVTLHFWRLAMGCLLAAIALWLAAQVLPALREWDGYPMLLGVLMIVGFAISAINGMLYKIVPFLVWFHLTSRRGPGGPAVPNVREILSATATRRQMWVHVCALAALLMAVPLPVVFVYPAAVLFAASNLWLWVNMLAAVRRYRRADALIRGGKIQGTSV